MMKKIQYSAVRCLKAFMNNKVKCIEVVKICIQLHINKVDIRGGILIQEERNPPLINS